MTGIYLCGDVHTGMQIDQELADAAPQGDTALTIGVFDGVHRGHRRLLSRLTREASERGLAPGVVTFREHPAAALRPDFMPRYLTTLDQRLGLLRQAGVEIAVPIAFDLAVSRLSAAEFVERLQRHLRMKLLVVGPDFAMGYRRAGNTEALRALGQETGFDVIVVDHLQDDTGESVRSTGIRNALAAGDMEKVARHLGRPFTLTGEVVHGTGRGGPLGFPTANVQPPDGMAVPADGIYAGYALHDGTRHQTAVSIGTRPTFDGTDRAIEAFILDFDGNLYGQTVTLEFVKRLREQVKFSSVEELQAQVWRDVEEVRGALGRLAG